MPNMIEVPNLKSLLDVLTSIMNSGESVDKDFSVAEILHATVCHVGCDCDVCVTFKVWYQKCIKVF